MNFHPDKQLFQVAGAGDRTTDPWITIYKASALPLQHRGTHWSTKLQSCFQNLVKKLEIKKLSPLFYISFKSCLLGSISRILTHKTKNWGSNVLSRRFERYPFKWTKPQPPWKSRTMNTQWRHKSKKSENLGHCCRQNMLWPYLKICNWELIFGRAVKVISSPGIRSPCWKS
jgi:hypothetical protein